MLNINIKQSLRQMKARKLTTIIQVIGLGIGLGSVILMLAFILHEYSFDKYHKNSRKLYRVIYDKDCSTPYVMGESFREEIPEIKNTFRIYHLWNILVQSNDEFIKAEDFMLADSSIFSILDIPIIAGNKSFLLLNSNDIVISDKAAAKYFRDQNPLGQSIDISISGKIITCNVSGIFKRFPSNSSIQSEFIGNIRFVDYAIDNQTLMFSSGENENTKGLSNSWDRNGFQTFLLIPKNKDIASVERKATQVCLKQDKGNKHKKVHLQLFSDMYFHSEDLWNYGTLIISNLKTIWIFEGIALLVLLIAWFNYILLSTAETKSQLREIACRKAIGASPGQISRIAYTRSFLITLWSVLPALFFVYLFIPFFNQLFDKNINMHLLLQWPYLSIIILIIVVTGIAGGSYIGFYSARLSPFHLLSPLIRTKGPGKLLPSGTMIVFQFGVFILLLSSAIFIEKQVRYAGTKNQGFNSNNVLIFRLNDNELRKKVDIIKSKLEANSHVLKVAISAFTPPSRGSIRLELGKDKNSEPFKEEGLFVGAGLIELLQIPIIEGSTFQITKCNSSEILINESAAKKYKLKAGDYLADSFRIRGILKDFHLHSVHWPIKPLFILKMNDDGCYELAVRSDGHNWEIIAMARKVWTEILPNSLFEYELLNDRISSFYNKERTQAKIVTFFSCLAIFLSVMGLFGYVSIVLVNRTKEIGIRKVNGADILEVIMMLNKDLVKWLVISFIISCPIAYYAMTKWLQNFAYKTDLSWWVFALAGGIALVIALLTVSWQSWRAATRNPVEALRYE
jgi:putative ABC transport system permease protein